MSSPTKRTVLKLLCLIAAVASMILAATTCGLRSPASVGAGLLVVALALWATAPLTTSTSIQALVIGASIVVALFVVDADAPGIRWLGAALGFVGLLRYTARYCAKATFRATALVATIGALVAVGHLGVIELDQERQRSATDLLAGHDGELQVSEEFDSDGQCTTNGQQCLIAVRDALAEQARSDVVDAERDAETATAVLGDARRTLIASRTSFDRAELDRQAESLLESLEDAAEPLTTALVSTIDAVDEVRTATAPTRTETLAAAVQQVDDATATLSDELATAQTRAETALDTAEKELEALDPPPTPIATFTLIRHGVDSVASRSVGVVTDDRGITGRLEDLAWVLVVIFAAYGYRALERRNNLTYGAPVAVGTIKVTGEGLDEEYVREALGVRFGETALIEPPGVPGSQALGTVATTLKDSGATGGAFASALVTLAEKTLFPASGVTLHGTVRRSDPQNPSVKSRSKAPSESRFAGSFSLRTTEDNQFIRSVRFSGDRLDEILNQAGAMVAADVLGYAAWTPSWTKDWGPDGEALLTYRNEVESGSSPATGKDGDGIAQLRRAHEIAPSNGFLRLLLAQEHEMEKQPLAALGLNLQNGIDHPRFLRGRYRLATSLSMAATPAAVEQFWAAGMAPSRRTLARDVETYRELGHNISSDANHAMSRIAEALRRRRPSQQKRTCLARDLNCWARHEVNRIAADLRIDRVLGRAWRQSERRYWTELLRSGRRRVERERVIALVAIADLRETILSTCELTTENTKESEKLIQGLTARQRRPNEGFEVFYNAACYWSIRSAAHPAGSERDRCVDLAFRCLARSIRLQGDSAQTARWLDVDPDLDPIRTQDDFQALKATIDGSPD